MFFQFGVWFGVFFCGGGVWGFYLGFFFGWLVLFFNPKLVHLLVVCTILAGLATFSIVFVGLQN